jgi:amidase
MIDTTKKAASVSPSEWDYRTIKELGAALESRQISASELLEHTIARIEALDSHFNAVVVRDFDRAREAARAADEALSNGERRPLLGIPLTFKEAFNVAGLPTTWGFPQFKDFVPNEDALIVSRVKRAGGVLLGKTNVPTGLGDVQSYNAIYGTTNNPWDVSRSPGGSSGGSAAALAAGFGPLSFGSDIGGSMRQPAHFCGVYAHKPTLGLVPLRGYNPPPASPMPGHGDLSVAGPMACHASDLALARDVIAGPDEQFEGIGYRLALPPARHDNLRDFRILIVDSHPLMQTGDAVRSAMGRLQERLARLGPKVAPTSELLPNLTDSARLFMKLFGAARSLRASPDGLAEAQRFASSYAADDRALQAERARGTLMSHRDWLAADAARTVLGQQWQEFFREWDVLVFPAAPVPAFQHDHSGSVEGRHLDIDGEAFPYWDACVIWADPASTFGLPATAAPIERSASGLPVGVQIIGPYLGDRTTIKFAELLEREFGGFTPPW